MHNQAPQSKEQNPLHGVNVIGPTAVHEAVEQPAIGQLEYPVIGAPGRGAFAAKPVVREIPNENPPRQPVPGELTFPTQQS